MYSTRSYDAPLYSVIKPSNYGTVYGFPAGGIGTTIGQLKAIPEGRRSIAAQYFNWIWLSNADDRCRNAQGTLDDISVSPVGSGGTTKFLNATGGDGKPSGYSGVWLDNVKAGLRTWGAEFAQRLVDGGASLDHLMFDEESQGFGVYGISTAHRIALTTDPRFSSESIPRLNEIISEATKGATTTFDTAAWLANAGDTVYGLAWNAYGNEQICKVMRALLDSIRTVFPNCTGSNYEYHGRSAAVTAYNGVGDLNGHKYYFTDVGDKWSSDWCYMEMSQQANYTFNGNAVSYWSAYNNTGLAFNPYHVLMWETRKAWAGLESGRFLKPWLTFAGSNHSHFLGGFGQAAATDPCPYWQAHNAMQLVLASVPQWIGDDWSPPGILYFCDEAATVNPVLYIGAVNASDNEFLVHKWTATSPNYSSTLRRGLLRSVIISGSENSDETYTVERSYYKDGGTNLSGSNASVVGSTATLDGSPALSVINLNTSDEPDRIIFASVASGNTVFLISAVDDTKKTVELVSSTGAAGTPMLGADKSWAINRKWHHLAVTEHVPRSTGNLGKISTTVGDAINSLMNDSVQEVSDAFGTAGPRKAFTHYPIIGQYDADGVEDVALGNFVEWVSARHGAQITYCIMIGRNRLDKATWTTHAITGFVNGSSVGTVATVPADRAHVLYTRPYDPNETLSFKWSYGGSEQAAPTNILTSVDFTDASWTYGHTDGGSGPDQSASYPASPVNSSHSWRFYTGAAVASFSVSPGLEYVVSVWAYAGLTTPSTVCWLAIYKGSYGTVDTANFSSGFEACLSKSGQAWQRLYLSFVAAEGETTYQMLVGIKNASDTLQYYCHPHVSLGVLPGPIS